MVIEYREKASAIKLLDVNGINGLPNDVQLSFSKAAIRYYKTDDKGYFFSTLAIPTQEDHDGFVFELEFSSNFFDEDENDLDFSRYEVPFQEHTFGSLSRFSSFVFEEKTEMGQRMLFLKMNIKGTPFDGYVLIDKDLYSCIG